MKGFSYEFWKDFTTITSYFLLAFSLIVPHITASKIFSIIIGLVGLATLGMCASKMIIVEFQKEK